MKQLILALLAFTAITILALMLWLLTTQSGLQWAYTRALPYLPAGMQLSTPEGRLLGNIKLNRLNYQHKGMQLQAEGLELEWLPLTLLAQRIDLRSLHIHDLQITLPEAVQTKGSENPVQSLPTIDLGWRLSLRNISLDRLRIGETQLHHLRLHLNVYQSRIDIQRLAIATNSSELEFSGVIHTNHQYLHDLNIGWQSRLPNSERISARGQWAGTLNKSLLRLQLSGPISGQLQLEIRQLLHGLHWQSQLQMELAELQKLDHNWPQMGASLSVNASGDLHSASLDARMRTDYPGYDEPVETDLIGQLLWHDGELDIARLELRTGKSLLSVRGRVAQALHLDWSVNAPDLSALYPAVSGKLNAKGKLSGQLETPLLVSELQASKLKLPDYQIDSIEGRMSMDLNQWRQANITLTAHTLSLHNYELKRVDIKIANQRLRGLFHRANTSADIELYADVDELGWHGKVLRAELKTRRFATWRQSTTANFNYRDTRFEIQPLCWHNHLQAKVCTAFKHSDDTWQAQLQLQKFPLSLLSPWLPADLKMEGLTDAHAELHYRTPKQLVGSLQLTLPAGVISYPLVAGELDHWEYRGGSVNLVVDEAGLSATAELNMNNGDAFHLNTTLPSIRLLDIDPQGQAVQAQVQLQIRNLGLLEAIVPEIDGLKGEAAFKLSVAGTLARPHYSGRVSIINTQLRIPRLGLNLDQFSLQGHTDDESHFNYQLAARSGGGSLTLDGRTRLDAELGWPTQIRIKGEQFELARIPEAHIQVSPDLQLSIQQRLINISGSVHIPYAKLQPKDITMAARTSDDAVIIGKDSNSEEKWSISSRIRLTLGERVTFYGYGIEGNFTGKLLLEDQANQLTRATGEINIVEGNYRAYGQDLTVQQGRLLFSGGPLTNPGLDLRAVRKVASVTAGLKVRGSLDQPQLELFSIPAMGQTDTLSYLLLGMPIENASGDQGSMMAKAALALSIKGSDRIVRSLGDRFGLDEVRIESDDTGAQASLVMGRYLSPKLYVSYGVSLIEAINTFNVRYQISDRWLLKGESGEHQGADLLYTIERD